jgi:2-polyprenyl-3-methyl-5-hydroxy-6-metoxy-1,4-benzoquinol methylase
MWLDPMPVAEDLPLLYANYFTHRPASSGWTPVAWLKRQVGRGVLEKHLGYEQDLSAAAATVLSWIAALTPSGIDGFLSRAMYLAPSTPGRRLLEIGCGSGEALARMKALGWSVLGADFDPSAVATAKGLGIDVRLGGVESLRPEDGTFDAIYLGHVVEHVPDPLDVLSRCRALLNEGGQLVLVTPNTDGLGARRFGRHWRGLEPPRHLHIFNPRCLDALCRKAGLSVVERRTTAQAARHIIGMSYLIQGASRGQAELGRPSVGIRLRAHLLHAMERAATMIRPHAGEELVIRATRSR